MEYLIQTGARQVFTGKETHVSRPEGGERVPWYDLEKNYS